MPSFDVVSEVDWPEVNNAVDQANREISTRYDFKNTDARVDLTAEKLTVFADNEFQVNQAAEILRSKLAKRGIDLQCLQEDEVDASSGGKARQQIVIQHGIDRDRARDLVKKIKTAKLKVQTSVQGEQLRVTGKKRDDLQAVIALLRDIDAGLPLQFNNFRD